MHNYMYSFKGTSEIAIDPNDVVINDAGTNMTVATYPNKELDRGNTKPEYVGFRSLSLGPRNRAILENIFLQEQAKRKQEKKAKQTAARMERIKKEIMVN